MNTQKTCLLAAFAAVVATGFPLAAAHAQTASAGKPAIYMSEFELTDAEGIKPYSAAVDATFAPFGGRYIVRGGKSTALEGQPTKRMVMIEFPSMEQAQAWYDSPAYRAIRPIRHKSAVSRVFIVEGVAR